MQETRINSFGSKIRSTILRQAKTGKHEFRKITATCTAVRCCYFSALVLTCFRLTNGRATYFRPETIVASFLHHMVFLFKVLFNHSLQIFFFFNGIHVHRVKKFFDKNVQKNSYRLRSTNNNCGNNITVLFNNCKLSKF